MPEQLQRIPDEDLATTHGVLRAASMHLHKLRAEMARTAKVISRGAAVVTASKKLLDARLI